LRLPERFTVPEPSLAPLLGKELRQVMTGRSLWIMLLLLCPFIGYSFIQAVSLYGEASAAGLQSPLLAAGLSPLDGILVPTFGAEYVAVTLMFPFVAIRTLGQEKESGTLRLSIQLPYCRATLVIAKLVAMLAAWLAASIPALSALVVWRALGGHLSAPETANLILGHLLYGLLVGSIALFAAAVSESSATAAIIALAFTIGSWVLDFTVAGHPGLLEWIARLSLTQVLRPFEEGLLSVGLVVGVGAAIAGFAALATVWLPPGRPIRRKLVLSTLCILASAAALGAASLVRSSVDVSEDRRNSFPTGDQATLTSMAEPLMVTVHLASEDPRYADLQRNVLAKLGRAMPNVAVRLAQGHQTLIGNSPDQVYGEVEYAYGSRSDISSSTSPSEILPLLYGLAGVRPAPSAVTEYPGYPLVAGEDPGIAWFFVVLPSLIALLWLRSRLPPQVNRIPLINEVRP
jgi:hypothetical protein